MYMNEYEIVECVIQYHNHPILGPATRTLENLMRWTNLNSDGWPYWQKPGRAAEQLMHLIEGEGEHRRWCDDERDDVTEAAYKKALVPVKSFRTRENADFHIEEIGKGRANAAPSQATDMPRPHGVAHLDPPRSTG